jgi:hypothetical protein
MADEELKLQDLNGQPELTLEELAPNKSEDVPLIATKSNRLRASSSAMMVQDPQAILETYNTIQMEAEAGRSDTLDKVIESQNESSKQAQRDSAVEILSDENLPLEVRAEFVDVAKNPKDTGYRTLLKERFASAENQMETPRDERARMATVMDLDSMTQAEKEVQKQANAALMSLQSSSSSKTFVELVELYLLPFMETRHANELASSIDGEDRSVLLGDWFTGSRKLEIMKAVRQQTPETLPGFMEKLIQVIDNEANEVFLSDENDYAKYTILRDIVAEQNYGEFEAAIDNVASFIEGVFFFNPIAKGVVRGSSAGIKYIKNAVSPLKGAEKTNAGSARSIIDSVIADQTDEAAEALGGGSKTDVIVDAEAPKHGGGSEVEAQTPYPTRNSDVVDVDVLEFVDDLDDLQYVDAHVEEMRSAQFNKMRDLDSAHLHSGQTRVEINEANNGFKVEAMYGGKEGGFLTAEEAIDNVTLAMRDFGLDESSITLMRKNSKGNYEEIDTAIAKELAEDGEYMAKVTHNEKFNPYDISKWEETRPNHRLFAPVTRALTNLNPKWTRYLMSPAAVQHQSVFLSAFRAADQESALLRRILKSSESFTKKFDALDKDAGKRVSDYIREANDAGFWDDFAGMKGKGLTEQEIDTLKDWRSKWDTIWHLENQDKIRTARAKGQRVYSNPKTGDFLTTEKAGDVNQLSGVRVLDTTTGEARVLNKSEVEDLYNKGGEIAKLTDDIVDEAGDITHILVANKKGNFLRAPGSGDHLLDYRKGYYRVEYKGNHVVRQTTKNGTAARGIYGTKAEADEALKKFARADEKTPEEWGSVTRKDEDSWGDYDTRHEIDLHSGRSAQRYRGKRLVGSDTTGVPVGQFNHVLGPADALLHSARSIARRVPMRQWLEGQKAKFMDVHSDLVPMKDGQKMFPTTADQLGNTRADKARVADARSEWEYIKFMEGGYANVTDRFIKGTFQDLGDTYGGLTGASRAIGEIAERVPNMANAGLARNIAFRAMIALSPIRQLLVQSHQFTQLAFLNPWQMMRGVVQDSSSAILFKMGQHRAAALLAGMKMSEFKRMMKGWEDSGLGASIDKHVLVEGGIQHFVDAQKFKGGVAGKLTTVADIPKMVGFDAGEYYNQLTAYMTFRRREIAKGATDIDSPAFVGRVAANSRNFTYGMNRAADMPYNQGAIGIAAQFMQVPHKALETMTLNRGFTRAEKTRLMLGNLVAFGVPTAVLNEQANTVLAEHPEVREVVVRGMETYLVNQVATKYFEGETSLNLHNLSPVGMDGIYEFFVNMFTGGIGEMYANSPSGGLFGATGRIQLFSKDLGRYMGVIDDGIEVNDAMQLANSFMAIGSGWSNALVAGLAMEDGKRYSGTGGLLDDNLTVVEKWAVLAGIPTDEMVGTINTSKDMYEEYQGFEGDVTQWYKELRRNAMQRGITPSDPSAYLSAMTVPWKYWNKIDEGRPARKILEKLLMRDLKAGDSLLLDRMFEDSGLIGREKMMEIMVANNLPQEKIDQVIAWFDLTEPEEDK